MNSTYAVVKQDDNFAVCDDVGYVIEQFSTAKSANEFVKDLKDMDTHSHYVATTDWTGGNIAKIEVDATVRVDAVETPVVECKKLVADATSMKKSDRVRARIALAKVNNEKPEVVVAWVIETLGMNKPLAKTYVKGNWDRA
jgi:hypothetical protein